MKNDKTEENMIGAYGPWAASIANEPPNLSLRTRKFKDLDEWRTMARKRVLELMLCPDTGGIPQAEVKSTYTFDGLHIEELSWHLPYGPPTQAIFMKPEGAQEPLPGILALHDHGGLKYFGRQKITHTRDKVHPIIKKHQRDHYGDAAWANDIAKQGYAVLVHDAFPFASRRVRISDVPEEIRFGVEEVRHETEKEINAYNDFAGRLGHETIMAKSLFYAGTTWTGVYFAEDQRALDYLCSRPDVDKARVGCGGLSGGGMRTIFLGGLDQRIKCACCVGLMSTHRDFLLNKCYTHTWMMVVPGLPRELDWPEILGLRVPLPTMVLNDNEDSLFTLPEMKRADRILGEVYDIAGAPENYKCSFYPGPHKFDRDMQEEAFAWFDRWLK